MSKTNITVYIKEQDLKKKQGRQCTEKVTLRRFFCVTTVAVEKQ